MFIGALPNISAEHSTLSLLLFFLECIYYYKYMSIPIQLIPNITSESLLI